jgi:hypothetical protein
VTTLLAGVVSREPLGAAEGDRHDEDALERWSP